MWPVPAQAKFRLGNNRAVKKELFSYKSEALHRRNVFRCAHLANSMRVPFFENGDQQEIMPSAFDIDQCAIANLPASMKEPSIPFAPCDLIPYRNEVHVHQEIRFRCNEAD